MSGLPLGGVRVLELANWMAGPSAGAVLADLGADVIKVEPLGGDAVRGLMRQPKVPPGRASIDYSFTADNRGKRSVAVAIDRPEGADVVRRLTAGVDVFSCNLLPQRQLRYGLDPSSLFAVNARLVHATLSGYGLVGPDADRPGFDVTTFFGRGAITDSMTEPGGVAPQARPAQGDHATGLAMVVGILAALRQVERTGEGQVVDASLLATAAWTMATDLSSVLVDGRQPTRRDRHHVISAIANRFLCADDRWIVLNMPEPVWWPRFCLAVDRGDLLDDSRFTTLKDRFDNMPELIEILDRLFVSSTLAHWGAVLDQAGLIWGAAATLVELVDDPQAAAQAMFPLVDHPSGAFRTVAVPVRIAGVQIEPRGPAPEIGEHTVAVLRDCGMSEVEIHDLLAAGIVNDVKPSS